MVFKVSVQLNQKSWNRKYRLNKAKVRSYVLMHIFLKTASAKDIRVEYEGVGVAVGK